MNRAIRFLTGNVRVRVEAAFPERVLNVCSAHGIAFRDLSWRSETGFFFTVSRREWYLLRRRAEKLDAVLTVERKGGVPFFAARFRHRHGLWIGFGVLAVLLAVNTCFVWDITVSGNDRVPEETILRAVEEAGVRRGSFAFSFRGQDVCNRVLPKVPELSWLTVNVRGCRAEVIVRERVPKPELWNEKQASNVVAAKDGLVTRVMPLDGEAQVIPGMTVCRNQLLISGVVETKGTEQPSVTSRIYAGVGEVWGRTWYECSVKIPLSYDKKVPTGKNIHKNFLIFGKNRIKIGAGSSNFGMGYDKIKQTKPLTLFGAVRLPAVWERETLRRCGTERATRTHKEAEAMGKETLHRYLLTQIGEGGSVTQEQFSSAVQGDRLIVTLRAECEEQLGRVVPIVMEQ